MQSLSLRRPWAWIVAAAIVGFGLLLGPRLYVADLEDALVQDANEIVAAPRARTVHVNTPFAGTFAGALRTALPRYEKAWSPIEENERTRQLLAEIANGEPPNRPR